MAEQTKGFCKYCGKSYARTGMLRHLSACKERKAANDSEKGEKKTGYFELLIYDKYCRDYWLIVEMPETAALKDLDRFIRDIWVECCGHLSVFTVGEETYASTPCKDSFWGIRESSMNYKLKDIFSVGMLIKYEYDYGSTTELVIKAQDYRTGTWKKEDVTILSRNNPPLILCSKCGKNPAQWINPEELYDGEEGFWCEECLASMQDEDESEFDDYEEFYLPVCNSPRMGVCGYEGSDRYPDSFEPDKK